MALNRRRLRATVLMIPGRRRLRDTVHTIPGRRRLSSTAHMALQRPLRATAHTVLHRRLSSMATTSTLHQAVPHHPSTGATGTRLHSILLLRAWTHTAIQ